MCSHRSVVFYLTPHVRVQDLSLTIFERVFPFLRNVPAGIVTPQVLVGN